MHIADYAVARCLSVCPFVTRRYCVKTAEHILNLFFATPPDSYTILVFPYQTLWQYSDRDPPPGRGRRMQRGYGKIVIFDQ